MRYDRFILPLVSLQLWACSDPHTARLDRATTGGIHAVLTPPLADFSEDGSHILLTQLIIHLTPNLSFRLPK